MDKINFSEKNSDSAIHTPDLTAQPDDVTQKYFNHSVTTVASKEVTRNKNERSQKAKKVKK
jgi:hypothetical protein